MQPAEAPPRRPSVLFAALLLALGALVVAANWYLATSIDYAYQDFMTLWSGGRALLEGVDPYDAAAWKSLRARYGSTWTPNAGALYPMWTNLLLVPFAALPLQWGAAVWLSLSEALLVASLLILLVVHEGLRPSPAALAALVLGAFLSRWTAVTIINGQISLVLVFVLAIFLLLMQSGRPLLAGFAAAFLALKPSPVLLLAPLLVLWLLARRRWRVLAGGALGAALLLAAGWLAQPGWLLAWLHVRGRIAATPQTPTVWGLAHELAPAWWPALGLLLAALVAAGVGYLALTRKGYGAVEVVSLGVAASLLVTPYIWPYDHTLLLVPLAFLFSRLPWRRLAMIAWYTLAVVLPWLLFRLATARGLDTYSFLVPLAVGLAFYGLAARRRAEEMAPGN